MAITNQSNTGSFININGLKTIFWAGLISGILDGIAASSVFYLSRGFNPGQVMQYIASGLYGPDAFTGGTYMICFGTVMHFMISITAAAVYYLAFPFVKLLDTRPVISGLLLGLFIWVFMNLAILPLTQTPKEPFDGLAATISIIWHMVLVGLPIALITKRYYDRAI